MKNKIEVRYIQELRAAEGDEMALVGYAALYNKESKNLGGFREIIAPGAFTRSLNADADIKCLFNHDDNQILGRTKSSTLTVTSDDRGLKFRCLINPDDSQARDIYARVKRGDIDQCSFAFTVNKDGQQWQDQNGNDDFFSLRTLTDVNLMDVSAVTYPAYDGTAVAARSLFPNGVPAEIRSAVKARKETRDLGDEEKCLEEIMRAISCALSTKYPATYEDGTPVPCGYNCGQYWVCETYSDYVIVCKNDCGPDSAYFMIPYHADDSNPDNYLFGEPQPVEKEWVAAERTLGIVKECRSGMAAMAEAHKQAAAAAQTQADDHSAAADAIQKVADRKVRCETADGDCEDKECDCQNFMVDPDDVWDEDGTDADDRSARLLAETRADGKVLTKKVGGKNLTKDKFAFVGDPEKTETWKLPIHDAGHVRNALARFNQTEGIPADKKSGVMRKIKAAAKKFGVTVSDEDSARALKDCPLDEQEIWEYRARLTLAVNQ